MEILKTIGLLLLSLSILVTIHELGHFWAARIFKMRVEIFSLFFGPRLFGFKKGDTDWRVSAIPLGGYVKIAGMMDESMDKEQLAQPPQPWEFRTKPRWQRLIVMLGGIIMNVVLGFVLFTGIKFWYGDNFTPIEKLPHGLEVQEGTLMYGLGFRTGDQIISYKGEPVKFFEQVRDPQLMVDRNKWFGVMRDGKEIRIDMPNDFMKTWQSAGENEFFTPDWKSQLVVLDSVPDSAGKLHPGPAKLAGLKTGDVVTLIDGKPVTWFSDVRAAMKSNKEDSVTLVVQRKDSVLNYAVVPNQDGKIGVFPMPDTTVTEHVDYGFGAALVEGPKAGMKTLVRQVKSLVMLGSGNANVKKSMGGMIKIGAVMKEGVDRSGAYAFWTLTAILSMVLAIMNLLPIPALDGGHVVFLLVEMIIGRDINEKIKERAIQVGFFLVLALIVLLLFKDTLEVFFGIS